MEFRNIILAVVIIILLIIVYSYIASDVSTLTGLISAKTMQQINASSLTQTNASNFTYSIWFYIDDWNTNYGAEKIIFGRMNDIITKASPCPLVSLSASHLCMKSNHHFYSWGLPKLA